MFNWVIEGLNRLLEQQRFTDCEAVTKAVEEYKRQSDSVQMFLKESDYEKSTTKTVLIKDLYYEYKTLCLDDGFKPVNKTNFKKRLENIKIFTERKNIGHVAYLTNNKRPF